jgi:hypothetical protein
LALTAGGAMNVDDEIRKLLGPPSETLRSVSSENFLRYALFRQSFQPEAVKVAEYLELLDIRLDSVVWNARPPYAVLLRFVTPHQRRYLVASVGATLRLHRESADNEHLLMECKQSVWMKLCAAVVKNEFGN